MISVGSRDGIKGLGFGGGEVKKMEEELEEGEAVYYQDEDQNNNNNNNNFDPDVHLSYIDEKLQHILGHFQKDFEGEVSAENLGSKFGGYGSFLPSYQRSPTILPQPRTPQKVQNLDVAKSPNNVSLKDTRQYTTATSSAPIVTRFESASTPVSRPPAVENISKRDACLSSTQSIGECTPKDKIMNKVANPTEQKTLKVRIKVGPDRLLAQNNAAIYSGLGLDISPSSSLEDSPAESGNFSPESHDALYASPMSILKIMTSFPVPKGSLMSPLSSRLLDLVEQEKPPHDNKSGLSQNCSQESPRKPRHDIKPEAPCVRVSKKASGGKKKKLADKKTIEVKNKKGSDVGKGSASLRREVTVKTQADEGHISNVLKLPLTSKSECNDDLARGTGSGSDITRELNKCVVKEEVFSGYAKVETLESVGVHEENNFYKEDLKTNFADPFQEDRRTSSCKDLQLQGRKERRSKDEKCGLDTHLEGSYEQSEPNLPHGKKESSTGSKRKLKGSRGKDVTPLTEFPDVGLKVTSSSSRKDKKHNAGAYHSKNKVDAKRLLEESGNVIGSSMSLFGDADIGLAENRKELMGAPSKLVAEHSKLKVAEKEKHSISETLKQRSRGKKVGSNLTSEAYPKSARDITPSIGNAPVSDAVATAAAPVVIEENWVCCDRCQKWRLLPYGTNPDNLPKKWLCSMLSWLPGMNRCNISEEETTAALNALYQLPAPEIQNNPNSLPDGGETGVTSAGVQNLDQTRQDDNLHAGLSGVKKLKSKEGLYATILDDMNPTQSSNSTKGNLRVSVKSKHFREADQIPMQSNPASGAGFQQLSKSSDIPVEKHVHKLEKKNRLLQDQGDTKHCKIKRKRGMDIDGSNVTKKIKTNALGADQDWISDHDPVTGKVDPNPICGYVNAASGKDVRKYSEYFSKHANCGMKDQLPASVKKLKGKTEVSLDTGHRDPMKCDKVVISGKKRKLKEWEESHLYEHENLTNTGQHVESNIVSVKEELSETELRKEKKARVSKSEGKGLSSSKADSKFEKKGRVTRILLAGSGDPLSHDMGDSEKDQLLGQYQHGNKVFQQSSEGLDISKRESGYAQQSVAADSSSSKVSGSRKSKFNVEVKSSPVESVSSSPLRSSNLDKVLPARRKLIGKDNATNVGFNGKGIPLKCADGVDGDNAPTETARMEKGSSLVHQSYLVSSVLEHQRDDANHTSGGKAKIQNAPFSSNFDTTISANVGVDTSNQHKSCHHVESGQNERVNNHKSSNGSQPRKSGKGSSLRSTDKHRSSKSVHGKGDLKASDSLNDPEFKTQNLRFQTDIGSQNWPSNLEDSKVEKHNTQAKCGTKYKDEKNSSGKKDSLGKLLGNGRKENQPDFGKHDRSDAIFDSTSSKEGKQSPQKRFTSDRTGLGPTPGKGKSLVFATSADKQETRTYCPEPIPEMLKRGGSDIFPVDAAGGNSDALKVSVQSKKLDIQNGTHHTNSRHSMSNGAVARDMGAPSPVRKDPSSSAASNAFKEAKDLKHTADRLKNTGLEIESTGIYFQAALKFLQGASILELCTHESAKHGEITYMVEMYSSTAKLCEFVAREYERFKEMASAALAYKCMEVAYMRIIYSRNSAVSKDRHELQTALQIVPPGESPSSSASDIDNLNNQGTLDKVVPVKGVSSPKMTGNHIVAARNHPNFLRLLNFAQHVNFAMDALRKSQTAFAAANVDQGEAQYGEGISSVKRVIDFTFYDVDGLLRLVRLAMEAISR